MSLRDKLSEDLKSAMRKRDKVRRRVIRGLMTAVKEAEQRQHETLVSEALAKHNIKRPQHLQDSEEMAKYEDAVASVIEAEDIEERAKLDDSEVHAIVQKLVKQHEDSIEDAKKAGREDLIEAEEEEIEVLEEYLPEQLSRDDIEAEARTVIEQTGASSMQDMGKVMGPLMERLRGQADGRMVSEVVRSLLQQN